MEANELMIGDWVMIENYSRICGIAEDGVYFADKNCKGAISFDHIEPIPLTAEILERNGFVLDGESWWYKDFRIVLSTSNGVSLICGRQMRFKYVHELQHALRLCQIDKEIYPTSKYIDTDKLIAEIERLKEKEYNDQYDDFDKTARNVLNNILTFITSLHQGQPHKSFCEENCKGYKDTGGKCFFDFNCSAKKAQEQQEVDLDRATIESYSLPLLNRQVSREELDKFARHFYELGLSTMRKRLADPEYNREVIEKMKSEYPVDESNAKKL